MKRTMLDDLYEAILSKFLRELVSINEKAITSNEQNIISSSCHVAELVETELSNCRRSKNGTI
jgi:hypothetical protein